MYISPVSNTNFKASVYDFVNDPTPEETKTIEHLNAELKKKVPHGRKGRTYIEWINKRGLEVCYSRPYETVIVKGYRNDNGEIVKVDENIPIGSRPYLSQDLSQFIENRPLKNVKDGTIQVDLTFRKNKSIDSKEEIFIPTTRGYIGDYNENDTLEFGDIKKVSHKMWKPFNVCYGIMSAIGIGCLAGLCWLIPMTLKNDKAKTIQKADTVELVTKAQPQKIAKNTLMIMGKKI